MCHFNKLHLIHPRSEPLLAPDLKGELVLDGGGELNDVDLKQVSYIQNNLECRQMRKYCYLLKLFYGGNFKQ